MTDPAALLRPRLGTDEAVADALTLTAGLLQSEFIEGGLRTVRYDGIEMLRAVAYVVRDKDWGTYAPVLQDCTVTQDAGGFRVFYQAKCTDPETGQSLDYVATIAGTPDGRLTFDVSAVPGTDFLTTRCGFAVLHPLSGVVGGRATVEHVDGRIEDAVFPERIAPWQPFRDIRAITHDPAPGLEARCLLQGDVFEMEDQRAWSDASFKTYVRPLALPWPYELPAGIANQQSVTLEIRDRRPAAIRAARAQTAPIVVAVGGICGSMPRIGLVVHPDQAETVLRHPSLLAEITPQLLLFHFDPLAGHDAVDLGRFARISELSGKVPEVCLEVALPGREDPVHEMRRLADAVAASGLLPTSLMVSPAVDRQSTPPGSTWPDCPPLAGIYQAAREAFPGILLGGGMLSYFTELNRKPPPVGMLDFVSHCTCPIVHASDDLSVMQSLEALPYIVGSARAIIGEDRRYRIGPSTIGMRQNPYGSRVIPNPDGVRMTMTDRDPRQRGLFAAAWSVGYLAAIEAGNLDSLVPGALTGSLGIADERPDGSIRRHPVFDVVMDFARAAGQPRRSCLADMPSVVAAVATVRADGITVLWLANLTAAAQTARIAGVQDVNVVLCLDDDANRTRADDMAVGNDIILSPYSVVSLQGR